MVGKAKRPASRYIKEWVIINIGVGRLYPIHVNHFDTNGTIGAFFWNEADPTLGRRTTADTIMRNFGVNDINHSFPMWVYGRDDDSLTRGGGFIVFADSAPRAITATYNNSLSKFQWAGLDAKDSLATEFRILVKKGAQPDTSATSPDTAKNWTRADDPAFSYTAGNILPLSWAYASTQGSGLYYFQIAARDRRGTKSATQLSGTNFFSY